MCRKDKNGGNESKTQVSGGALHAEGAKTVTSGMEKLSEKRKVVPDMNVDDWCGRFEPKAGMPDVSDITDEEFRQIMRVDARAQEKLPLIEGIDYGAMLTQELAAIMGCTRQAVYDWHTKYGMPRNEDGTFDFRKFIKWFVEFKCRGVSQKQKKKILSQKISQLKKFCKHAADCPKSVYSNPKNCDCTCGLDKALNLNGGE